MELEIKAVYSGDQIFKLMQMNNIDGNFLYYRFYPEPSNPRIDPYNLDFMKHQNIRDALIQATSYRSGRNEQLESTRADFSYFIIQGEKIYNLRFLNYI